MKITTKDILTSDAAYDIIETFQEDFYTFLENNSGNSINILEYDLIDQKVNVSSENIDIELYIKFDGTKEDFEKLCPRNRFDYYKEIELYYANKLDVDEEPEFSVQVDLAYDIEILDISEDPDDGLMVATVAVKLKISV